MTTKQETFTCCACNEELPIEQLHVAHDSSDDFDYCEACFAKMEEDEKEAEDEITCDFCLFPRSKLNMQHLSECGHGEWDEDGSDPLICDMCLRREEEYAQIAKEQSEDEE